MKISMKTVFFLWHSMTARWKSRWKLCFCCDTRWRLDEKLDENCIFAVTSRWRLDENLDESFVFAVTSRWRLDDGSMKISGKRSLIMTENHRKPFIELGDQQTSHTAGDLESCGILWNPGFTSGLRRPPVKNNSLTAQLQLDEKMPTRWKNTDSMKKYRLDENCDTRWKNMWGQ